jgi:cyclohexyl-isocyanide hydratase
MNTFWHLLAMPRSTLGARIRIGTSRPVHLCRGCIADHSRSEHANRANVTRRKSCILTPPVQTVFMSNDDIHAAKAAAGSSGGECVMSEFNVGFVIFPGITQLDFTGPFEVLSRLATPAAISIPSKFPQSKTHVIARTMLPVSSDRGLGIMPSCTFATCPPLDLICVPGGAGVVEALADAGTVDFIRRQGERATYVTSVCIGAFLLGSAGLLKGRRAATHWAYTDLLPLVGARHERGRIVRDGNVFTSGGVSAGIDFSLSIVAEIAGPEVAQAIQLAIEYDPSPPFDAGHPDKAPEAATALMVQRNAVAHLAIQQHLEKLRAANKV